jgi:hypothetical protein
LRTLHGRRSPLLHQGPPYVDHLFCVGSAELLELSPFGFREPMSEPEDLRHGVGLLLDRVFSRIVFLPNGDDNEGEQHGVDHTQGRVDEAGDVVVLPARVGGNEALH